MAEHVELASASGGAKIATDRVDESGTNREYQLIQLVTGADSGTKTLVNTGNPLPVLDSNSASALTALQLLDDSISTVGSAVVAKGVQVTGTDGTNARVLKTDASGELQVDVLTLPNVTVGTLPAIPAGTNNIGDVDVLTLPALPAGTNNIGDVDILSIAAGDNNIGNVDVVTLPSLPSGTNNIGDVDVLTLPSLPAGTNNIGDVDVLTLPAIPAGTNNIGDVDVLTLPALPTGSNNIGTVDGSNIEGDVAHDSADSGNPVKIGFKARTADPTAVANGDRVDAYADTNGKLIVLPGAPHDLSVNGKANYTNNTAADVIAAQGSGIKIVVTDILVTNAHGTVGTKVEIRDGTTVKIIGQAEENGGGFGMSNPRGLLVSTANTAITARCVTTGADVDVFLSGYTIKN